MARQGRGVAIVVVVATISGMAMMNPGPVQGQAVYPSTPAPKAVAGPETNIIPSVILSERYDSNVYFIAGHNLEDYVTSVSPQLRVVHMGQLVEGTVGGGVTAEAYVKNPGLNYVAANGVINLNLDGAMSELVRGLGLQISDTFRYTPQLPSFAAPTDGGEIPASALIGIQAQRANSSANAGTVAASYSVSPLLSFTSTYLDQRIRFGSPISTPTGGIQARFVDSTFQTVKSGPVLKVSPTDTLTLSHQYQKGTFEAQGPKSDFSTQGVIAGWTSLVTPTLTASMTGGVTVFSTINDLQYVGSASLLWKGQNTDLTLSYTRMISPSFFIAGVPLLSQVIAATATHHMTESFSVLLNGNYAVNQSIPDSSLLKFESYSVTPSMQYKVNRVMTATLSYTHSWFDQTFLSQGSSFDRNLVMLRIFAEWK
jgi:hypothetical protein